MYEIRSKWTETFIEKVSGTNLNQKCGKTDSWEKNFSAQGRRVSDENQREINKENNWDWVRESGRKRIKENGEEGVEAGVSVKKVKGL